MTKYFDFLVVPQGKEPSMNLRMPSWLVKVLLIAIVMWLIGLITLTIFYGKLSSRALAADMLENDNERLRDYMTKVVEIENSFRKNMALTARIAEMAGIELEDISSSLDVNYDSVVTDSTGRMVIAGSAADIVPLTIEELEKLTTPKGRPLYGWITRGFNPEGGGGKEKHVGIDIAVREGTPVVATATGEVTFAGWDKIFGNLLIVDHKNGFETVYGHNQKNLVSKGQKVYKFDVIALSGNTGRSSAPHLHYEVVKDGEPIDPSPYLD